MSEGMEKNDKRCPDGSHQNKKKTLCIKNTNIVDDTVSSIFSFHPVQLLPPVVNNHPAAEGGPTPPPPPEKRKYCPKGQRWDPELQRCISIEEMNKKKEERREQKNKKKIVFKEEHVEGADDKQTTGLVVNTLFKKKKKLVLKDKEKEEKEEVEKEAVEKEEEEKDEVEKEEEEEEEEKEPIFLRDTGEYDEQEKRLLHLFNTDRRKFLIEKEKLEQNNTDANDLLYPQIGDAMFNAKIDRKKEFDDTRYDGTIYDIKTQANKLCAAKFELMPHQLFVKNFMSVQTPYNALLLYHNLGTGKTCSAIGVAEEMRQYMKSVGYTQKILIVASPNVQDNFRLQLFDENKLQYINGTWNFDTCIGNSLIKEINPSSLLGLSKKKLIAQIKQIINTYYEFKGYTQLAKYIDKKVHLSEKDGRSEEERNQLEIKRIQTIFSNRLIIVDEVHNIRIMAEKDKNAEKTAGLLMMIAEHAENMRLLLLSATPAYNSYHEIIWLANLLNAVDKRAPIKESEVFKKDGTYTKATETEEDGEELLRRKLTGYVSYVRGENPYTFPFRLYPETFSPENALSKDSYPTKQLTQIPIMEPLQFIPVYISNMSKYQQERYIQITAPFRGEEGHGDEEIPTFENMESVGAFQMRAPLQALSIVYPYDEDTDEKIDPSDYIGKKGLQHCMSHETITVNAGADETGGSQKINLNYEYKPEILEKFGRIFSREELPKYSHKIAAICDCIRKSEGIILVYSEYIDGGIIPIALALEEMGMKRYGSANYTKSLFKTPPPDKEMAQYHYVMITGNAAFSPDNLKDVKYITNADNKKGEKVKVVLISRAAAEGVDFKNIRQVHILEPWYNVNRIEQIIGRGVRNLSHCGLEFEDRNVEIYLHSTRLHGEHKDEEAADLYMYRYAEKKAVQIGRVTRLLKEIAVDCHLNIGQTELTVERLLSKTPNQKISIRLSSTKELIPYQVGDRPFTHHCDYMEHCNFTCSPEQAGPKSEVRMDTYHVNFMKLNFEVVQKKIRQMFREQSVYQRKRLIEKLQSFRNYPIEQILYTLSHMIYHNETIKDQYDRIGKLVNKGDYYLFTPIELVDPQASIFERVTPIDYKRERLVLELPTEKVTKEQEKKTQKKEEKEESGPVEEHKDGDEVQQKSDSDSKNYDAILLEVRTCVAECMEYTDIETKDTNWYKHMGRVFEHIHEKHSLSKEKLVQYAIYHYLDTSPLHARVTMLDRFFGSSEIDVGSLLDVERVIKAYLEERMISKIYQAGKAYGIILADKDEYKVYLQSRETQQWNEGNKRDLEGYTGIDRFVVAKNNMNIMIGFMSMFEESMVFKTKDFRQKRNNRGSKCDIWGKADILKRINFILGSEDAYTSDNTKTILKPGICIIMEIMMRYYSETKKNGKEWFLTAEQGIMNDVKNANF